MLALPLDLTQKFQTLLAQAGVPINQRPSYHKWLRYYLDFCRKYHLEPSEKRHFPDPTGSVLTFQQYTPFRAILNPWLDRYD